MYLVYYDEAGDDGYPRTKSDLFALSALYMHESNWKYNFDKLISARNQFFKKYGLASWRELHTRKFMEYIDDYQDINLDINKRIALLDEYVGCISKLKAKVVNCVINKTKINRPDYLVLDNCLSYSIQRIENDLKLADKTLKWQKKYTSQSNFLIFIDQGREAKMVETSRRIQKNNLIKSLINGNYYQSKIKRLIEDPLPKISSQSLFIQVSDFIVSILYLYMKVKLRIGNIPKRIPSNIDMAKITEWFNVITPILNLKASRKNPYGYGIVCYPR